MKLSQMQLNIIRRRFEAEFTRRHKEWCKHNEPFIDAKKKTAAKLRERCRIETDKTLKMINKRLETLGMKVSSFECGADTPLGRLREQAHQLEKEINKMENCPSSWDVWTGIQFDLVFAENAQDIDKAIAKALKETFK